MSNIEWTDATWNPVIGCRHVAEGCRNCCAETMSKRLAAMGQADYASILTPAGKFSGHAITRPDTLPEPLKWRRPRMVFVNSMSDLFHDDVPFEFIAAVYGVMAACPQHTFQVLTKRPERMLEFLEWLAAFEGFLGLAASVQCKVDGVSVLPTPALAALNGIVHGQVKLPLSNVWHGVSVAKQKDADRNIPILLKVPSAIRFISAEPLIGPVELTRLVNPVCANGKPLWPCSESMLFGLDWVIVGGESGPGARPCDVAWIRSIVEQCKAAGVACFVKQLGSRPVADFYDDEARELYDDALEPFPDPDDWDIDMSGQPPVDSPVSLKIIKDRKGADPSEWPDGLRVREFPATGAKA